MEENNQNEKAPETKNSLLIETARWARYVAIICFIYLGLTGILTLSGIVYYIAASMSFISLMAVGFSGFFTYFIFLFFLYPAYQLYQFSDHLLDKKYAPEQALSHLKKCFKSLTLLLGFYLILGQLFGGMGVLAMKWLG